MAAHASKYICQESSWNLLGIVTAPMFRLWYIKTFSLIIYITKENVLKAYDLVVKASLYINTNFEITRNLTNTHKTYVELPREKNCLKNGIHLRMWVQILNG